MIADVFNLENTEGRCPGDEMSTETINEKKNTEKIIVKLI